MINEKERTNNSFETQLLQKMLEISKECYRLELSRKTKEGIKNSKKIKNKECAKNEIK